MNHPIILFDGVCNLCNGTVNFIIDRDPGAHFRFASLQSKMGQTALHKFGLSTTDMDTFVLIEGEKYSTRSTAALRIAKMMKMPYPLFYSFIIIPLFIRNSVYDLIARNRYQWFGKMDVCRVPSPELKERFLE